MKKVKSVKDSSKALELGERILLAARVFSGGQSALADYIDVHRNTVARWIKGKTSPTHEQLRSIARATATDLDWLATGEGQLLNLEQRTQVLWVAGHPRETLRIEAVGRAAKDAEELRQKNIRVADEDASSFLEVISRKLLLLPKYDVSASAGAGALVQTNSPDGFLAVDREWLSRYVSRNANVGVLEASGDSMMPTIRNRDLLLVDAQEGTTVQEMMRGAIYVMTLDGGLVVKRLDIDGNILLVVSDNPAYETVRIPFEDIDGRLIIHGVVFWSGGALDTHR